MSEYTDLLFDDEKEQLSSLNWEDFTDSIAVDYPDVPSNVVKSLINRESSGDPLAEIDTGEKWGMARGLGQFIDSTAKRYIPDWETPDDSYDPQKNITGIYNYLNDLVKSEGDIEKALIKYHGGGTDILGTKSSDYAQQVIGGSDKFEDSLLFDDEKEGGVQPLAEEPQKQPGVIPTAIRAGGHILETLSQIPTYLAELEFATTPVAPLKIRKELEDPNTTPERKEEILSKMKGIQEERKGAVKDIRENPVALFADKVLEETPKIQDKHKSIGEAFNKGVPQLLEYMGHVGLENAGNAALFLLPGGQATGLTAIGLGQAGVKSKELQEKIDKGELEIDEGMKLLNAAGTGAAEAIPELFGTGAIVSSLKKSLGRAVKEVGKEAAKKSIGTIVKGMTVNFLKGWGQEFAEENVTEISTIVIDEITGVAKKGETKEKLSNYITETMPELAAATWTGGSLAAAGGAISDVKTQPTVEQQAQEEAATPVETFVQQEEQTNVDSYNQATDFETKQFIYEQLTSEEQQQVTPPQEEVVQEQQEAQEALPETPEQTIVEEEVQDVPQPIEARTEEISKPSKEPPLNELDMGKHREDSPTKEEGQQIAEKLGLRFDGLQETADEKSGTLMSFTNLENEGTFYAYTEQHAKRLLDEQKKRFVDEQKIEEKEPTQEKPKEVPVRDIKKDKLATLKEKITSGEKVSLGDVKATLVWDKTEFESAADKRGYKSSMSQRAKGALKLAEGNPTILSEMVGKSYEQIEKIATKAGLATAKTFGVETDIAKTFDKVADGVVTYTPAIEQELRDGLKNSKSKASFESLFEIQTGKKGKVILVNPNKQSVIDGLRGSGETVTFDENISYGEDEDFVSYETESGDGPSYKLRKIADTEKISDERRSNAFKTVAQKMDTNKNVVFRFVDQIKTKSGDIQLSGKDADTDAVISQNKNTVFIDISRDVRNTERAVSAMVHESIGHFGAQKVLSQNKKAFQNALDAYDGDIDSDFTNKLREEYKEDLDKIKDNNAKDDYLFNEWVAHRIHESKDLYINEDGTIKENSPNAFKKVWETVKNFVKDMVGATTTDDKINRMVKQVFDNIKPKKTVDYKIVDVDNPAVQIEQEVEKLRKKKPPKPIDVKTLNVKRARKYVDDRAALESGDVKAWVPRWANYINDQLTGSTNKSYRKELFDTLSKVKEPNKKDINYNKALKLVDTFKKWDTTNKVFKEVDKFNTKNKKILTTKYNSINNINNKIDIINNNKKEFNTYITLKRLLDRKLVLKPFKKGTTESTTPGEKYQLGIDNGFIEIKQVDGKEYYAITGKGRDQLKQLSDTVFDSDDIQEKLNEVRIDLFEARNSIDEFKDKKTTKRVTETKELVDQINTKRSRKLAIDPDTGRKNMFATIRDGLKRSYFIKTKNIEFISRFLDNFDTDGAFKRNVWDKIHDGRNKQERFETDSHTKLVSEFDKNGITDNDVKNMLFGKDKRTIQINDGKGTKEVSSSQLISLFMLSQNEKGLAHLLEGGFAFSNTGNTFDLSVSDLNNLKLTKKDLAIASSLFEYYDFQAQEINKVSNKTLGFDIASEEFYHPIKVKTSDIKNPKIYGEIKTMDDLKSQVVGMGTPGALKSRKGSRAPIVLEGAFEALNRSRGVITKYVGYSEVYNDVNRLLNSNDVKNAIGKKGFEIERKHLLDAFDTKIQPKDRYNPLLATLDGVMTNAILGYKASIASIQPVSFMLYASQVPSDISIVDIVKNFKIKSGKKTSKLIEKYSPMLSKRERGFISRDFGDLIMGSKKTAMRQLFLNKPDTFFDKFNKTGMFLSHKFDLAAIHGLWHTAEAETRARGTKESDPDFYKKVARRTEELVTQTQPTFDDIDRPTIVSGSFLKKQLSRFTSQPIKNLALISEGIEKMRTPGKRASGAALITNVFLTQAVMFHIAKKSWQTVRGNMDEDDWKDGQQWFKDISSSMLGMFPIVGSFISSTIQGYGIKELGPYSGWIDSTAKAYRKIIKEEGDPITVIEEVSKVARDNFLPVGAYKEYQQIIENFND